MLLGEPLVHLGLIPKPNSSSRHYGNETDIAKGIEAAGVPRSELFVSPQTPFSSLSCIPPWCSTHISEFTLSQPRTLLTS